MELLPHPWMKSSLCQKGIIHSQLSRGDAQGSNSTLASAISFEEE